MGSCRYLIIYDRMLVTLYDIYETMKRARNVAAPANAQIFDVKTPCKTTGKCFDRKSLDTICLQFPDYKVFTSYRKNARYSC